MPSWGELLVELNQSAAMRGGQADFDGIRRKYLSQLHQPTGRDTIVYSTDFLAGGGLLSTIILEDMQGMMEVCRDLNGPGLDLILHCPGKTIWPGRPKRPRHSLPITDCTSPTR